jgi:hypothetical protein
MLGKLNAKLDAEESATMYGDIDHVLVGPLGLFAIECKHYSGHITYHDANGLWTRVNHRNPDGEILRDPVEQLLSATQTLQRVVSKPATPIVVFTNDRGSFSGEHPQSVVLELPQMLPWIRSQHQCLSAQEVQQIVQALTRALNR